MGYKTLEKYIGIPYKKETYLRQRALKTQNTQPANTLQMLQFETPLQLDSVQIVLPCDIKYQILNNVDFIHEFAELIDKYKIDTKVVKVLDTKPAYLKD